MGLKLNNVIPYAIQFNGNELTDINFTDIFNNKKKFWYSCFNYTLQNDDTYSVKARDGVEILDKLVIPSKYNNKPVTAIGNDANTEGFEDIDGFEGCTTLKEITIPDSVTDIVTEAFMDCLNLSNVSLSNNITEIKNFTFADCANLENITIPDKVTSIGNSAFYSTQLSNVTFGENSELVYIKDRAFYAAPLKSFDIPDGVTDIGEQAFYNCTELTQIVIPDSVKRIERSAFDACSKLAKIFYKGTSEEWYNPDKDENKLNINSDNEGLKNAIRYFYSETVPTDVGNYWYYDASGEIAIWEHSDDVLAQYYNFSEITEGDYTGTYEIKKKTGVTLPNDITIPSEYMGKAVTKIDYEAFRGCTSLTSLVIGDSVATIGSNAFWGCTNLSSVAIGNSVTHTGSDAFYKCDNLTGVYITDIASWCNIEFGNAEANPLYYAKNLYLNNKLVKELVIPDSVTTIGRHAFCGCDSLINVAIGNGVTSIGDGAFIYCSNLTSVVIPNGVTKIANSVFQNCESLTSVVIPNSVTSIGYGAFLGCKSITSITIPDSVITIGESAFERCPSLTSIVIPNGVTSIGSEAFYKCDNIAKVYYKGTKSEWGKIYIDNHNYCLTNDTRYYYSEEKPLADGNYWHYVEGVPTIWDKVTVTEDSWFTFTLIDNDSAYSIEAKDEYNNMPNNVVIPSTHNGKPVTTISRLAFAYCENLVSVTIPNSIITIESNAFFDCPNLSNVIIEDGVKTLGNQAFSGCPTLTSIVIPDSVTTIDTLAFSDCNNLTNVTIGSGVTSVDESAFAGCDNITTASIPTFAIQFIPKTSLEAVTITSGDSIGYEAFRHCDSLVSVVIGDNVTSIGDQAFSECYKLENVVIGDSVTSIGEFAFQHCDSLSDVYYNGTETVWAKISISSGNSSLTNATLYYYSENHPTEEGNFWHLVDGEPTVWCCEIVTDAAVAPTCTETGLTEGKHCSVCDTVLVAQETVDALTHNFTHSFVNGECEVCGIKFTPYEHFIFRELADGIYSVKANDINNLPNEIVIPSTYKGGVVIRIDSSAFEHCHNIEKVTIPDGIEYIDGEAFSDCYSLTSVVIPDSVIAIGSKAFFACRSLTEVVIGNSVHRIGTMAFAGCAGITDVVIPASVAIIEHSVFTACWNLNIEVADGNIAYKVQDGCLIEEATGKIIFANAKAVIPSSTSAIGTGAFSGNTYFAPIKITKSITVIESLAFQECENLTVYVEYKEDEIPSGWTEDWHDGSIDVKWGSLGTNDFIYTYQPDTDTYSVKVGEKASGDIVIPSEYNGKVITAIDDNAFENRCDITSVTIPDSIKTIGHRAFKNCSSITELTIPDSVEYIGHQTLSGCSGIASLILPYIGNFDWKKEGEFYEYPLGYHFGTEEYTGGVATEQEYYTYWLDDGSPMHPLEKRTFYIPKGLRTVEVHRGNILHGAFQNCTGITKITLPTEIDKIGKNSFLNCENLEELIIPVTLREIDYSAFEGCSKVIIQYYGDETKYRIENNCLVNAESNEIIFGNQNSEIPSTSNSIGKGAFYGNTYFAPITIPLSVTKIGSLAFGGKPVIVYVEASHKPTGWADDWHDGSVRVIWGSDCVRRHSYSSIVKKPTCLERGHTTHTCSSCGYSYKDNYEPALGHIYQTMIVSPTCTEQGYTNYVCARCGDAYQDNFTEALGHNWEAATCTTPKTCSECGITEGEALGHIYGDYIITVAPTCTKFGTMQKTCSVCGHVETAPVEPLGHTKVIDPGVVPTCTTSGLTHGAHCKVCGLILTRQEFIPELGHDWMEATCTEPKTCSRCGETDGEALNPLNHAPSDWIVDIEPTTETEGSKHKECTRCGIVLETAVIPKLPSDDTVVYLIDENGNNLTDEQGNLLVVYTSDQTEYLVDENSNRLTDEQENLLTI